MELISLILLVAVVVATWLFFKRKGPSSGTYNLPPGPKGLPLIGCPWLLFHEFHKIFTELTKEWGDIFSFQIFGQNFVVLNSLDSIRDALTSPNTGEYFAGRPELPDFRSEQTANNTTFLQPSARWNTQRKLVHKALNMYGDGVQAMEDKLHDELEHVSDWLKANEQQPIDLDSVLYPSLINIITILLIGRREEYGSKMLENIRTMDEGTTKLASQRNLIVMRIFPFIRYIPIGIGSLWRICENATDQFVKDFFDSQKTTYDPEVTRGMVDYLLRQQEVLREEGGEQWLSDVCIQGIAQEMVGAGSMTTRSALSAFFLLISQHPEAAKRIQSEIEEVCPGRLPSLRDRSKMNYTMATIVELLRYISHVAVGVPRVATDDVTFKDFRLPAKTCVMVNLWKVHHDPVTWSDPWVFRPERFLSEDGTLLPAEHHLRKSTMPFGVGRRSCVGEVFARSRLFLFVTTLLQKFHFTPDPSRPLPSCDPRYFRSGILLSPPQYYVTVKSRH